MSHHLDALVRRNRLCEGNEHGPRLEQIGLFCHQLPGRGEGKEEDVGGRGEDEEGSMLLVSCFSVRTFISGLLLTNICLYVLPSSFQCTHLH